MQIEIAPAIAVGGGPELRQGVVRGHIVSAEAIEAVALWRDGAVVASIQYGQHGGATAEPADGAAALNYVFMLDLPLPKEAAADEPVAFSVQAHTRSEQTQAEAFVAAPFGQGDRLTQVLSGPTYAAAPSGDRPPPVMLHVERATIDDTGVLRLGGWAASRSRLVTVQVFAGERRVRPANLGFRREDVAAAHPAYPNGAEAGFSLSATLAAELRRVAAVRVQAIVLDGVSLEVTVPLERLTAPAPLPPARIAAPPPPDPRRAISLFCDEALLSADGTLDVTGWAVCATGIARVTVRHGDTELGEAELGLARDDVGREYTRIALARNAGWRLRTRPAVAPPIGAELRIEARNGLDDAHETTAVVQASDAAADVPARQAPEPEASRFRFQLDNPLVAAGTAVTPVTGRLTIEGWVVARGGIEQIDVLLDEQRLGAAHHGLARQDVGAAFPDWDDALRSGFAFHCPPRSLRNGPHAVQLDIRARDGATMRHEFTIEVRRPDDAEDYAAIRRRVPRVEADLQAAILEDLGHRPAFRLFLRDGAGPPDPSALDATLDGLRAQSYANWRLCAATDSPLAAALAAHADLAPRVALLAEPALGIEIAGTDTLIGLLAPGDELGADALAALAIAGGLHRDADFLYADEQRVSPASGEREPFFKPDFSPDLLLSTNYIGRPWFATATLLGDAGITAGALLRDAEYDLVLRCTEAATRVHHVAKLLCRRAATALDDAAAEQAALHDAARRRGIAAEVTAGAVPGSWRFRRTQPVRGLVSIIIPTCGAHGHIRACIEGLRARTGHEAIEIIAIDNIPAGQKALKAWLRKHADKVIDIPEAFNWSRFNNRAAAAASGEFLLFLNDDIETLDADWLDVLLAHAARPEIGVVGPRLLYPDRTVQHAGMFLATPGIARHAFRFASEHEPGYFGLARTERNVIAVTGACMLVRRASFAALGGFDEAHAVVNNDLDYCLRAHRAGLLTVYTPHATLMHHELASRDRMPDTFDTARFHSRWRTQFIAGDPYFNPLLSRHADDFRPDDEPVQAIHAGHPLFRADEIKRILAMKLDHIGDFVTALPALRRLKRHFPHAELYVLTGRAVRAFAAAEPAIAGCLEFEFFHARSALGQRDLTEEDYADLRVQLQPYRFDLAVDFRKQLDTREVLRQVPARLFAGFDSMGQFPFLDIALEWEGDRSLHRKRNHAGDDLLNLVDAIATAGDPDRGRLAGAMPRTTAPPDFLPAAARRLWQRPVVAVHPGAGNITKQWPAEHFAALIDLLMEQNGVNVVLIGGPDEAALADEVRARTAQPQRAVSLAGKTPLASLPALLASCALYVGNDSGPKHIAAALGIATIGVHSGVVDATEWGPLGPRAVALRRNMACSPCYLSRLEDCTRGLACLRQLEPAIVQQAAEMLLARPVKAPAQDVPQRRVEKSGEARRRRAARRSKAGHPSPETLGVAAD